MPSGRLTNFSGNVGDYYFDDWATEAGAYVPGPATVSLRPDLYQPPVTLSVRYEHARICLIHDQPLMSHLVIEAPAFEDRAMGDTAPIHRSVMVDQLGIQRMWRLGYPFTVYLDIEDVKWREHVERAFRNWDKHSPF